MERRAEDSSFAISEQGTDLEYTSGRNTALNATTSHLIAPHGGELVQLQVPAARAAELKAHSKDWPSWDLTARQLCDLELLMSGGFSPLRGFMNRADYEGVCHNMRLANGTLWPMPITLDVTEEFAKKLTPGIEQDRAARSRRRDARRAPRGRCVAARPQSRSAGGFRFHQRRASRRRLRHQQVESLVRRRKDRRAPAPVPLRFPLAAPDACRTARRIRAAWAGPASSPSRRAIPCIALTSS